MSCFKDYIDKNYSDSELSVETMAQDLGFSRVQFYRKIKATTGRSPVDLLRKARLLYGKKFLTKQHYRWAKLLIVLVFRRQYISPNATKTNTALLHAKNVVVNFCFISFKNVSL